jgi:hypothetical protein
MLGHTLRFRQIHHSFYCGLCPLRVLELENAHMRGFISVRDPYIYIYPLTAVYLPSGFVPGARIGCAHKVSRYICLSGDCLLSVFIDFRSAFDSRVAAMHGDCPMTFNFFSSLSL